MGIRRALRRIGRQQAADQGLQPGRRRRPVHQGGRQPGGSAAQQGLAVQTVAALEGMTTRHQPVQQTPQGEEIRAHILRLAQQLLGRDAAETATSSGNRALLRREPEIGQLYAPLGGHQHVPGLDVTVHDTPRATGGDGSGNVTGDNQTAGQRQLPLREELLQVTTGYVFHDHGEVRITGDHIMNRDHPRAVQRGHRLRLAQHATALRRLCRQGMDFGHDASPEAIINTQENRPLPPAPNESQDPVGTDAIAAAQASPRPAGAARCCARRLRRAIAETRKAVAAAATSWSTRASASCSSASGTCAAKRRPSAGNRR